MLSKQERAPLEDRISKEVLDKMKQDWFNSNKNINLTYTCPDGSACYDDQTCCPKDKAWGCCPVPHVSYSSFCNDILLHHFNSVPDLWVQSIFTV